MTRLTPLPQGSQRSLVEESAAHALDCLDLDHTAAGIEPKEDLSTTGLLARRASNGRLGRGEKVILAWPMTKVTGPDLIWL